MDLNHVNQDIEIKQKALDVLQLGARSAFGQATLSSQAGEDADAQSSAGEAQLYEQQSLSLRHEIRLLENQRDKIEQKIQILEQQRESLTQTYESEIGRIDGEIKGLQG